MQSPLETSVQSLRNARLVEEICAWTQANTSSLPTTRTPTASTLPPRPPISSASSWRPSIGRRCDVPMTEFGLEPPHAKHACADKRGLDVRREHKDARE